MQTKALANWVQFDKKGEETCWTEVIMLKSCLINFKKDNLFLTKHEYVKMERMMFGCF